MYNSINKTDLEKQIDKIKTHEVGGKITLCVIASCFGLVMLLGDFVPSSGVALVLFIMVALMLNYLTSLQTENLKDKIRKDKEC